MRGERIKPMDKWICIKKKNQDDQMINMRSLEMMYCTTLDDETMYSNICFCKKKNDFTVWYKSTKNRDCHWEQIQIFINQPNCFFLQIESDIT